MKALKIQIQLLQKKQVSFPGSSSLLVNVSVANEQKSLHQHCQKPFNPVRSELTMGRN